MTFRLATLLALLPACALATPDEAPFTNPARLNTVRPATIESNWTRMKMPDGGRTAFASVSYMMAFDDDWGFGPGFYGTVDRSVVDKTPALEMGWKRDPAGEGAVRFDNRAAIAKVISQQNAVVRTSMAIGRSPTSGPTPVPADPSQGGVRSAGATTGGGACAFGGEGGAATLPLLLLAAAAVFGRRRRRS